jgi:hypothetical protein
MTNANSLGGLTALLNPGGQQRLFEFLDGVDMDTAASFRGWLGTANTAQLGAVAELLNRAGHGREFAGWWRTHDRWPAPAPATRPPESQRERPRVETFHSQARSQQASRDVQFGGLWLAGGFLVTLVTYSLAASNPRGGSFIVAYGAMIYGAFRLMRGLKAGE